MISRKSLVIIIITAVFLIFLALSTPRLSILNSGGWNISSNKQQLDKAANIYIYLSGEIRRPGVYESKLNTKVVDLINLAGGFTENADVEFINKELNIAETVKDNQKIYIPSKKNPTESNIAISNTTINNLVNLNTATIEELDTLPGIGKSTAEKIIANRPYNDIEDLQNVEGIGEKKFNDIKNKVTVE